MPDTETVACQFGACPDCPDPSGCGCACHMTCCHCRNPMPAAVADWHIGRKDDGIHHYCSEACANA